MNWQRFGIAAVVFAVIFVAFAVIADSPVILVFGAALIVAILLRERSEARRRSRL